MTTDTIDAALASICQLMEAALRDQIPSDRPIRAATDLAAWMKFEFSSTRLDDLLSEAMTGGDFDPGEQLRIAHFILDHKMEMRASPILVALAGLLLERFELALAFRPGGKTEAAVVAVLTDSSGDHSGNARWVAAAVLEDRGRVYKWLYEMAEQVLAKPPQQAAHHR
jgi:hypothetical protein